MRVKLKVDISGTHNGVPFPPAGEEADVPDEFGAKLLASGQATGVKAEKRVETAVADTTGVETSESPKRGPGRPRKAAAD